LRVEQYVGQRIRERRDELGMTQEEYGRQIGHWLGKPWSRSTVSVAESGKRAFTAAELVAIAHVLDTSPAHLLTPPAGIGEIDMPSGASVQREMLFAQVTATPRENWNLAAIQETLTLLRGSTARSQELAQDLDVLITQRVAAGGVVSLPLAPGMDSGADRGGGATQEQPIVAAIVTSPLGVLVGRRNDGKPPWTFIAGEVEPGERPEDAAVREVKEETGCLVKAGRVIGERDHPATGKHMIYMAARPTHGTDVFVGDEVELAEVRWVSLAEADELLPGMYEPVREHLARELGA
jgi:8-oxo-dGTP pyrophosphatase MutT (NUDIX family)/transcriptional regulator with XRE-family HTH domain